MDDFIAKKAIEYADSKIDPNAPQQPQKEMECFDWADIASAFEAGARWMAQLPPWNEIAPSPPQFDFPVLKRLEEMSNWSELPSTFDLFEKMLAAEPYCDFFDKIKRPRINNADGEETEHNQA